MIEHDVPACRLCGCPLRPGDELDSGICDPCYDFNAATAPAHRAADYAGMQREREQREAWAARKRQRKVGHG